ncbi:MAG: hypothetical protein ACFCU1_04030 [Sumerlaeia bacterium]
MSTSTSPLSLEAYAELPDSAQLKILSITQELTQPVADDFLSRFKLLFQAWHQDGKIQNASGAYQLHRAFLILAYQPTADDLSGCTKDQMTHMIQHQEQEFGFPLLSTPRFAPFINGKVEFLSQKQFRQKREEGIITDSTLVCDHLIATLGELRVGKFLPSVTESWYAPIGASN